MYWKITHMLTDLIHENVAMVGAHESVIVSQCKYKTSSNSMSPNHIFMKKIQKTNELLNQKGKWSFQTVSLIANEWILVSNSKYLFSFKEGENGHLITAMVGTQKVNILLTSFWNINKYSYTTHLKKKKKRKFQKSEKAFGSFSQKYIKI